MKRILTLSVFALAVVALTEQKAMAWKKFGFNTGLSINMESGDNVFLWGAFRNGPVPGSQGHGYTATMTQGSTVNTHGFGGHGNGHDGGFGGHGHDGWHGAAPSMGGFPYAGYSDPMTPSFAGVPSYNGYSSMPSLPMPLQSAPAVMPMGFQNPPSYFPGN